MPVPTRTHADRTHGDMMHGIQIKSARTIFMCIYIASAINEFLYYLMNLALFQIRLFDCVRSRRELRDISLFKRKFSNLEAAHSQQLALYQWPTTRVKGLFVSQCQ